MAVLMSASEDWCDELKYFFGKYNEFLAIETIISFIKGRNYDIIKHFYELFLLISQKEINQEKVSETKDSLEKLLEHYNKENQSISQANTFDNRSHYVPFITKSLNKGAKISQAFLLLTDAIKQYQEWRKSLNKEAIQAIYLKNLQDKQRYYFKTEQESLNQYLMEGNIVVNNYILRQSLIEFYNGISHLNAAYLGIEEEVNIDRAEKHFIRGALDSHKAIIKDFCFLVGNNPFESIIKGICSVRQCECKTIGKDEERNKQNLYHKYENFTSLIIKS